MKRKTLLTIPLLLTLVVLSQSLTPPSTAVAEPHIYITDASIIDTDLGPGNTTTISIRTNYTGPDIWGYEFTLTYNPLVLNGSSVTNGDLITDPPYTTTYKPGTFDNTTGELSLTTTFFTVPLDEFGVPVKPFNTTSGTGNSILANVTFLVVGTGDTPITLGAETRLIGYDSGTDDTYDIVNAQLDLGNIGHGYFSNVDPPPVHNVKVVSGELDDYAVYKERIVTVNVTVKNEGDVNETLVISIYWRAVSDDWLIYNETEVLDTGVSYNISVPWNTTIPYGYGIGNVTVVVDEVFNETDTVDNMQVIGTGPEHIRILGNIDYVTTESILKVDIHDWSDFIKAYPSYPPDDPEADLNFDGTIDSDDFVIMSGNLGKSETG